MHFENTICVAQDIDNESHVQSLLTVADKSLGHLHCWLTLYQPAMDLRFLLSARPHCLGPPFWRHC